MTSTIQVTHYLKLISRSEGQSFKFFIHLGDMRFALSVITTTPSVFVAPLLPACHNVSSFKNVMELYTRHL